MSLSKYFEDNSILFIFDFDGVVTVPKWSSSGIFSNDLKSDWDIIKEIALQGYNGHYRDLEPIEKVRDFIQKLPSYPYILSHTHCGNEALCKCKFLYDKGFNIPVANQIYLHYSDSKYKMLKAIVKNSIFNYDKVIYVDDSLDALIEMERTAKKKYGSMKLTSKVELELWPVSKILNS